MQTILQLILLLLYYRSTCLIRSQLLKHCIQFYVVLYGLQIIMAIWDPYSMHTINIVTVVLFNLQIIFFILGAKKTEYKYIRNKSKPNIELRQSAIPVFGWPNININKILIVLCVIYFANAFYNYTRMQSYIATLEMVKEGRDFYYNGFFPSYTHKMFNSIVTALKIPLVTVSFIIIFSKVKYTIKDICIVGLILAGAYCDCMTSMGRGELMFILIIFLLFCIISKVYYVERFKKIVPIAIGVFSIVAASILITTLIRFNIDSDQLDKEMMLIALLEPFSTYFYGPICAFDYGTEKIFNFPFPFFGLATLAGFWDFILIPFEFLNNTFATFDMNSILGKVMTEFFFFPGGQDWNALFTGCINYYLDFGYLGFLIFPFFHGSFFAKFVYKQTAITFFLLCFLFSLSFKHIVSLGIQSVDTAFTLIWMYYLCKRKIVDYT